MWEVFVGFVVLMIIMFVGGFAKEFLFPSRGE